MSAELALPARLDLPAAKPLAEAILALRGKDLRLAAGDVTHLGTPGLQVMLAAVRSWEADGKTLSLSDPSDALTEQLALCGLSPEVLSTSAQEA
ncbi:STAS domain-containing protein [Tropicimonas sp. TH_r6]|uniref:STAS domain-containing protein n=1 Tax=Tropicimonas sp. TH_r6 TaxID=3082085 RepID=UPI002953E555|nr:STAS domain-containing protein [Tropicimonas sp. TH_r6]MDV7145722.1 STAS domain-containing protein [Tropicimonas sp. TH_r6]